LLLFFLINIISYIIILKINYLYFKQKIYYPFRVAEMYTFILHSILAVTVMIYFFKIEIEGILLVLLINGLICFALYQIGFLIQSSPRTKMLLDLYDYKTINKDEYSNIYNIDVILDNRLKRFCTSNQIQIENTTVTLKNKKSTLLKIVAIVFKVFTNIF